MGIRSQTPRSQRWRYNQPCQADSPEALVTLENAYGVPPSTAALMLSNVTQYNGITDSAGTANFLMISTIEYQINVTDALGYQYQKTIYPLGDTYQIQTMNATVQSQAQAEQTQIAALTNSVFNTTFTESTGGINGMMSDYIYDSTGKTNGANCWFTDVDNGTTWWINQTWPYGSGMQIIKKTVPVSHSSNGIGDVSRSEWKGEQLIY